MTTPPELIAGSATGSIYDLGYRGYDGPRLGRGHALRALVVHGLRAVFGLGRSGRAKVVPVGLGAIIALPAIVSVGILALAGESAGSFNPITLEGYLEFAMTPLVFLVAAQAPELIVRDQRHRTLTLYFSRALERSDYVLAKLIALVAGVSLVLLVPQVALMLGTLFVTPDFTDGLVAVLPDIMPAVVRTLLVALLLSSVALAASAFTVRRAFAAAATIAVFLVPSLVVSVLVAEVDLSGPAALTALLDPFALVDGVSAVLFDFEGSTTTLLVSDLPTWLFAAGAVVVSLAATALLLLRYRRIAA